MKFLGTYYWHPLFHSSDLPFLMFPCLSAVCGAQAPPGWLCCGCSIKLRAGCHIFLSLQLASDRNIAEHSILQINFTISIYSRGGLLIPPSLPLTISIYIYNLPWIIISHIFYFSVLVVPSPRQGVTEAVVLCLDFFPLQLFT